MVSNQYAIELVTYLLVLVVYFYEFIVYMLLERNAFDSIAFFSQCTDRKPRGYENTTPQVELHKDKTAQEQTTRTGHVRPGPNSRSGEMLVDVQEYAGTR